MLNELTKRFKEKIEKDGIRLRELEKQIGIPYDRMYKWLHGKGNPRADDEKVIHDWLVGKVQRKNPDNSNDYRDKYEAQLQKTIQVMERLDRLEDKLNELITQRHEAMHLLEERLHDLLGNQEAMLLMNDALRELVLKNFADGTGQDAKKLEQNLYNSFVEKMKAASEKGSRHDGKGI